MNTIIGLNLIDIVKAIDKLLAYSNRLGHIILQMIAIINYFELAR
jgi:hypothetical protein